MKKVEHKRLKEMSYDAPSPNELKRWIVVGRGPKSTFAKPQRGGKTLGQLRDEQQTLKRSRPQRTVVLDADVAAEFKNAASVNGALRRLMTTSRLRKRSA